MLRKTAYTFLFTALFFSAGIGSVMSTVIFGLILAGSMLIDEKIIERDANLITKRSQRVEEVTQSLQGNPWFSSWFPKNEKNWINR